MPQQKSRSRSCCLMLAAASHRPREPATRRFSFPDIRPRYTRTHRSTCSMSADVRSKRRACPESLGERLSVRHLLPHLPGRLALAGRWWGGPFILSYQLAAMPPSVTPEPGTWSLLVMSRELFATACYPLMGGVLPVGSRCYRDTPRTPSHCRIDHVRFSLEIVHAHGSGGDLDEQLID
ncbi:hypothetical protein GE09DRAFT_606612 [Coniochaeta sp. 2T2.1]|nr:hypothetical protein GE09DRAFT_606612 [Coniochaeta sp. 2T2.1]